MSADLDYLVTFILPLNEAAQVAATLTWVAERTGDESLRRIIASLQRQADAAMMAAVAARGQSYMTPTEAESFRKNLEQLRNGGT